MTPGDLIQTARLSLQAPRRGMRVVLGWHLSAAEAWIALGLMAIMTALILSLITGPLPPGVDPITAAIFTSPFSLAGVQFLGLVVLTLSLHLLGRVARGKGTFAEALVVMGWLEAILIVVSVGQTLVITLVPPLAIVVVAAGLFLSLWLLTNFVAELHGYASLPLTVLGIVASTVVALLAMVLVMVILVVFGVVNV